MAGNFRFGILTAFAAAVIGCEKPPLSPVGERIDGPYVLSPQILSPAAGKMICYQKFSGGCDLRIAPPVAALGWDEDFISVAVRQTGEPSTLSYYYIVRDFDGPRADIARAVRGPFDEQKFIEERRRHGVPGVAPLDGAD